MCCSSTLGQKHVATDIRLKHCRNICVSLEAVSFLWLLLLFFTTAGYSSNRRTMHAWLHSTFCLVTLASISSAQFFLGQRSCLSRCTSTTSLSERLTRVCRCDKACEVEGNCCQDYWRYCSKSCRRRCYDAYHPLKPCQCHEGCEGKGCCEDFERRCVLGINEPETSRPPPTRSSSAPTPSTTPYPIERGYSFYTDREIECPKGIPFVSCAFNPCDQPCEKYPDARCLVNECGTCEAKYIDFVGNELNCYHPEKYCPNGERIFDCGGEDLCFGPTCAGFPRAICVPNKCGGCFYDFVDEKGNLVDCEVAASTSPCGEGIEEMHCSPPPCAGQTCAANIIARCRNIVCGECRAEFYNTQGDVVNCTPRVSEFCQDACIRDPCINAQCHANPDAECIPRKTLRCGSCEAFFILEGRILRDIDCAIPDACKEMDTCDRNPCQMYTCPGRTVICLANYCNGCNALFFDRDGRRIPQQACYDISKLNLPICPDGNPADICPSDLCMAQRCGSDYSPNCKPNECDHCTLQFFDDEGNEIDCDAPEQNFHIPGISCKDGVNPLECDMDACATATCPGYPDAECNADPCNQCKLRFLDADMNELKCEKPEVATELGGRCYDGLTFLKCSKELCRSAVCAAKPDALCKANPCDNCRLMFFDSVGRMVNCDSSLNGTCEGKCGSDRNATATCNCDYDCNSRGDCCSDYAEKCETCSERCGEYTPSASCQCTNDCRLSENCCLDFADICLVSQTCEGRCNSAWNSTAICQCHRRCVESVNCCLDYALECA